MCHMTLAKYFNECTLRETKWAWRIYGNHSHRLLCEDYGSLPISDCTLDNLVVLKRVWKNGYYRVLVEDTQFYFVLNEDLKGGK